MFFFNDHEKKKYEKKEVRFRFTRNFPPAFGFEESPRLSLNAMNRYEGPRLKQFSCILRINFLNSILRSRSFLLIAYVNCS